MNDAKREIEQLEHAFWTSLVRRDVEVATQLLAPKALMVGAQGAMQFDPAQYAKMLERPKSSLLDFKLSNMAGSFPADDVAIATYRVHQSVEVDGERREQDVFDSATWVRMGGTWKCVAHTESEGAKKP